MRAEAVKALVFSEGTEEKSRILTAVLFIIDY